MINYWSLQEHNLGRWVETISGLKKKTEMKSQASLKHAMSKTWMQYRVYAWENKEEVSKLH